MRKIGSSNVQILHPLIGQMVIIPSPSPRTLHWSSSSLLVDFCVHHGFDPGGARQVDPRIDIMNSCQLISHPLFLLGMGMLDGGDRPLGIVMMVFQFLSLMGTESLQEEEKGMMIAHHASDWHVRSPQSMAR